MIGTCAYVHKLAQHCTSVDNDLRFLINVQLSRDISWFCGNLHFRVIRISIFPSSGACASIIVIYSSWSRRIVDPPLIKVCIRGWKRRNANAWRRKILWRSTIPYQKTIKSAKQRLAIYFFDNMFYGVFFGNGVGVSSIDEMTESNTYVENKCQS